MTTKSLTVKIAKLGETVTIPDFYDWTDKARRNSDVVGVGRILNDAVAGVARTDYNSDEAFREVAHKKIRTRIANLRNADAKTTVELTDDQKKVLAMDPTKLAELIALLDANQSPASDAA